MFHVLDDLCLKTFRKIFIFTQSFKNVYDFYPCVVQNHSSVEGKFSYFVLMDEFRPIDWLTN